MLVILGEKARISAAGGYIEYGRVNGKKIQNCCNG